MGPPRTYDMDELNRTRFLGWLGGEWANIKPLVADLLDALERRAWRDPQIICPKVYHRLGPGDLALVRSRLAELIERMGGEYKDGEIVYRADDGRYWAELGRSGRSHNGGTND